MAAACEADNLKCGLCLNTLNVPKFLPCHHTFCASCVEDLVKNTAATQRHLHCPSCRCKFKLPPGGVSQLQTNFYLLPLLNTERCTLHRTETLKVYCTDCKTPICITCRMTDHFKHDAQDLGKLLEEARAELKDGQKRLGKSQRVLTEQAEQVQNTIRSLGDRQQALESQVEERAERLKRQFNTMVTECSEELMRKLQFAVMHFQQPFLAEQQAVQNKMATVQSLQQEVTQALKSDVSHSLLTLSSDMLSRRGSQQGQRELTSDLPVHTDRPVLIYDDKGLQRDVIKKYLGHVSAFQPIPLQQSVTAREVFRCCEDTQLYVHAVCVNSCSSFVCVAYGASGTGGEGWLVKHRQSNELKWKSSEKIRGRVCLGGLSGVWVRVEGKEFPPKDWLAGPFFCVDNKSAQRKYDVYNKGDARFVLRVHESGLCDLRSVTTTDYKTTIDVTVCEVSAKSPIAMDVSKDGRLVAVLEEGQDHVMLYHHGNTNPHAIYRGLGEAFRPLDVCFCMIGGKERLVIADWLNDVLHVLEVGESCKLIGHVGGEGPELVKPTALCADHEGRLWIGCQGGRVSKLEYTDFPSDKEESDSFYESYDSEAVHSEPKRQKTCVE